MADAARALRASLAEQLAALRGTAQDTLPAPLLDVVVTRVPLPGEDAFVVRPADWEALRHEEGAAARPIPYWARLWPSGMALAETLAAAPPASGTRVLELGCGLGLPSIVAARAGAVVLATDGASDAVAFAAHGLALNETVAEVAVADWTAQGDLLVARGPWDLVLAADVLYTATNVDAAARLLPALQAPGGRVWLADPRRAGARDLLAAVRRTYTVRSEPAGEVLLHTLQRR